MRAAVTHWKDNYGLVTFRYKEELCSVMDYPGQFMEICHGFITLEVWLGTYPTPELVEKVLKDFHHCNPEARRGTWVWKNGVWREEEQR